MGSDVTVRTAVSDLLLGELWGIVVIAGSADGTVAVYEGPSITGTLLYDARNDISVSVEDKSFLLPKPIRMADSKTANMVCKITGAGTAAWILYR